MKAIIGLGNPGANYASTRHNVGFWVIDKLLTKYNIELKANKQLFSEIVKIHTPPGFILAKPTTFMNNSGSSALAIANWYHIASTEILIIHDDVALPVGKMRFSKNGGAGGQHGVESIIECLGKDFTRLRIGIGPDPGGSKRAQYVLDKPNATELTIILQVIAESLTGVDMWLNDNIELAMNTFNGLVFE